MDRLVYRFNNSGCEDDVISDLIQWACVGLIVVASLLFLYDLEWQLNAIALGMQYFCVFILLMVFWPANMAGSYFVSGWVSILILTITLNMRTGGQIIQVNFLSFAKAFHLFAGLLVLLVIISSYSSITAWFPSATSALLVSALSMIMIGFLTVAVATTIERTIFSLLSIFSGFQIAFTQVDNSVMMVLLICIIMLSMSLIGSYYILAEGRQ